MKRKFIRYISIQCVVLLLIAGAMVFVDPYFHYHAPLAFLDYRISEERYVNDGISRHFEFDGIITGTSMNQNFKTTEAEALFGGTFVKETFSGAAFAELSRNLENTIERNPNLSTVIWGLDYNGLRRQYDFEAYEMYPDYLYDNNPLNDVYYVYNKDILYNGLWNTLYRTYKGEGTTSFDEYASWKSANGFLHIMESYDREYYREHAGYSIYGKIEPQTEAQLVYENITKNLIPLIENHQEVTFYLFFSPYCILYWDSLAMDEAIEIQLEAERMTSELLLQYPNVRLFSFFENTDLICNLDLYRNKEHYIAEVNSEILEWMANGEYEITLDNLDEHMNQMYEIYTNFDYEAFYQQCVMESQAK